MIKKSCFWEGKLKNYLKFTGLFQDYYIDLRTVK